MSAAEDSNATVAAERWVAEDINRLCQMLCVPAAKAEEIVRDWSGGHALDVVMARAAWELDQLPEARGD